MKTATMAADYHSHIKANITATEAFDGISKVSAWWAKNFEGSAGKQNDVFTVRFGETFVTFEITEMVRDKWIVWAVQDCHLPWLNDKKEWNGTKVIWEITSSKINSTAIDMTHVGLVPGIECYDKCESGWDRHIKESLFKLLTEHKGLPS